MTLSKIKTKIVEKYINSPSLRAHLLDYLQPSHALPPSLSCLLSVHSDSAQVAFGCRTGCSTHHNQLTKNGVHDSNFIIIFS
ncbi:hypothetical protein L6452_21407 [Arctium lappa]|uniref:Uncharacterized protein n=1 Tax=Arctium lappa TaxID=4217 RepID=A0ACB9AYL0_ARCLA|nr:hypothetical protein L6452_21407 [Arctium lappa]